MSERKLMRMRENMIEILDLIDEVMDDLDDFEDAPKSCCGAISVEGID